MNMRLSLLIAALVCSCAASTINKPKSLTVSCKSLGNVEEFRDRVKIRTMAEDKTTILLLRGEQLTINFELPRDATVEVLDLRYSNDGDNDEINVYMDDVFLGGFKTTGRFAWGHMWNNFTSSGPVGEPQDLKAGRHSVTMKVLDADGYGVEIDYIRINVHGDVIQNLDQEHFICVHNPGEKSGETPGTYVALGPGQTIKSEEVHSPGEKSGDTPWRPDAQASGETINADEVLSV